MKTDWVPDRVPDDSTKKKDTLRTNTSTGRWKLRRNVPMVANHVRYPCSGSTV